MHHVVLAHFASEHVLSNFSGACFPRDFDIDAEACERLPSHRYYLLPQQIFKGYSIGHCPEDGSVGLCSTHGDVMRSRNGQLYGGGIEIPFDFGSCTIASSAELEGFSEARKFLSEHIIDVMHHPRKDLPGMLVANYAPNHIFTSTNRIAALGPEHFGLFVGSLRRRLSSDEYDLVSCVSKKGQQHCPWARWIALLSIHCPKSMFKKYFSIDLSPSRCRGAIGIHSAASPYEKLARRRQAARESWIAKSGNMVVPLNERSPLEKVPAKNCLKYFFVVGQPANFNDRVEIMREQSTWGDVVMDESIQDQVSVLGGEPGTTLKTWRAFSIIASLNVSFAVSASDDVYIHMPRLLETWHMAVSESRGKMVLLGHLVEAFFLPRHPHFGDYNAVVGSGSMPWPAPVGDVYVIDSKILKFTLDFIAMSQESQYVPRLFAQDDQIAAWLHFLAKDRVHYAYLVRHGSEWIDVLSMTPQIVYQNCAAQGTAYLSRSTGPIVVHFGGHAGTQEGLLTGLESLRIAFDTYGDISCAFPWS